MPPVTTPDSRCPPSIAVVIPTYNRVGTLLQCLEHLERQTQAPSEVVVVDDGSGDGTAEQLVRYASSSALPLRVLEQANAGPARARNRGLAAVRSTVTLLLGDDTFARPDLLERHSHFHQQHPQAEAVAVGLTRWAVAGQTVTPFMEWLDQDGVQFHYSALMRGDTPGWKHFYTSNLSAKTRYLQEHPFDETFQHYGLEDIELGYRLARRHGLQMGFLPEAVVEHLHPTDLARSCRRARVVGAAEHRLGELWPEHRPVLEGGKHKVLRLLSRPLLLPWWQALAALSLYVHFPNALVPRVLQLYRVRGYLEAARMADVSGHAPAPHAEPGRGA